MEKRVVRDDSLSFKLYTLWARTLWAWLFGETTYKIEKITSKDIKDSCSYKLWVVFGLLTLPFYLILCLGQGAMIVLFASFSAVVYVVFILAGFWIIFDSGNTKKVWGDEKWHNTYPYKYCPWTGSYLRFAPWQIIPPLALLYFLFFRGGAIYKTVIFVSSGVGTLFSDYMVLGAISCVLFFYFLFKIWRSEFVKELQEDIKRKYCIPVELVKTEKTEKN